MSNWAFIEHVTDSMARPRQGDSKHPTFWPSEASATIVVNGKTKVVGKCKRAAFFRFLTASYKFYPKYAHWRPLVEQLARESIPVDRYMQWIWRQGELYEDFLVEQAKISGVFVHGQTPIYVKDLKVSGKTDVVVINPETKKLSIVEAKSVHGFGGNVVLGSPADRKAGRLGRPRDSNLMQIAVYDWWKASEDPAFEESRLVYGDRGTGRYAEYLVDTVTEEDGTITIKYKPHAPNAGPWVTSPITVNSILESYKLIDLAVDSGKIPDRDFLLIYNEEQLATAHAEGELTKTDKKQYEKVMERKRFNAWVESLPGKSDKDVLEEAIEESGDLLKAATDILTEYGDSGPEDHERLATKLRKKIKVKTELKQVEKGDFQCRFCSHKVTCYTSKGVPKEI